MIVGDSVYIAISAAVSRGSGELITLIPFVGPFMCCVMCLLSHIIFNTKF